MRLALAMIVRGADDEAELLDRCLSYVSQHVDGIFITSTHKKGEEPNKKVAQVTDSYGGLLSTFEWQNDFALARNFNFSQVPKEYDYIMWLDADDCLRGAEKLKEQMEAKPETDAWGVYYLYDFDEYKMATVAHKKTMIVRNDGSTEWAGAIHEDFKEKRALTVNFFDGIERLHLSDKTRFERSQKRNVAIAEKEAGNDKDPRTHWNLGNAYLGDNQFIKAKEALEKFLSMDVSEDEAYIARLRLSDIENGLQARKSAIQHLHIAIGMKPLFPDAYLLLGGLYYDYGNYDKAEEYLLGGLLQKPAYHTMIVYNPRDYDYNPMMLLAKTYISKSRYDLALPMLKGCLKIYPENKKLAEWVEALDKENEKIKGIIKKALDLRFMDEAKLKKELKKLERDEPELARHPAICQVRNERFIKTESSGKDLVIFCGQTNHEWNPIKFRTEGIGGSEEAVINLAREWAKLGWNVTVYNNCGIDEIHDEGVTYKPFWMWNTRDKQDVVILWRHPRHADYEINSPKVYVDMHDVIQPGEFTESRLRKITGVFLKSKFHREHYHTIPDEKVHVIPNGIDLSMFTGSEKDQFLVINTSSPDRSMDVFPKIAKMIKEKEPKAKFAWAYGWQIFEQSNTDEFEKLEWMKQINKEMEDVGIENLGRLKQADVAKLYEKANVFLYPTEFAEIDCISARKAQAAGAMPVTTDFAALDSTVNFGKKIHSSKTKDTWHEAYKFHYGVESEEIQREMADAVVEILQNPIEDRSEMRTWAEQFTWDKIGLTWNNIWKTN